MVHDLLRHHGSDSSTKTIGHHHEQTLCTRTDGHIGFLIDKQGARNVEEIERNAINQHRKDEHPYAIARITPSEQGKTKHPAIHGNKHDILDAEAFQGKRDEQQTEGFRELRERYQDIGMLHTEGIGIFRDAGETIEIRIGKSVRNL